MTESHDSFDESLLSAYLDGELKDEERAQVERVLHERSDLRAMLLSLQSTRAQLRTLQVTRPPSDLRQKVLQKIQAKQSPSVQSTWPTLLANRFRWAAVAAAVAAVVALIPWVTSDRSNTHLAERVSESDRGLIGDSSLRQDSEDFGFAHQKTEQVPGAANTNGAVGDSSNPSGPEAEQLAATPASGEPSLAKEVDGDRTESVRRRETLSEVQVQTLTVDALSPEMQSYALSNGIATVLNVKTATPITRDELIDVLANREIEVDELSSDADENLSESRAVDGLDLDGVETQSSNGQEVSSTQIAAASGPVTTKDKVAEQQKDEETVRLGFKNNQWSYRQRDADTIVMIDAPLPTILSLAQEVHDQSLQQRKLADNVTDLAKSFASDDLERGSGGQDRAMARGLNRSKSDGSGSKEMKRSLNVDPKKPQSGLGRTQLRQLGRAAVLTNGIVRPSLPSEPQVVEYFSAPPSESRQRLNSPSGWGIPAAGNDRVLLILSPE